MDPFLVTFGSRVIGSGSNRRPKSGQSRHFSDHLGQRVFETSDQSAQSRRHVARSSAKSDHFGSKWIHFWVTCLHPAPVHTCTQHLYPVPAPSTCSAPQAKLLGLYSAPQAKILDLYSAPQAKILGLYSAPQAKNLGLYSAPQAKNLGLYSAPQAKMLGLYLLYLFSCFSI